LWAANNVGSWHALFVATGHEERIKRALDKHFDDQLKFIIPKRELKERKAGKWHLVKRYLFPGYILLKGKVTVETYYRLKQIPVLARLLKNEDGPLEIEKNEIEVIKKLIGNEDGHIGISTAYKINDRVKIISGPLAGLEGYIQSVDKRHGRAKVSLSFLGEPRIVQLGIDIVDKANVS